jgi:hypothetical protein
MVVAGAVLAAAVMLVGWNAIPTWVAPRSDVFPSPNQQHTLHVRSADSNWGDGPDLWVELRAAGCNEPRHVMRWSEWTVPDRVTVRWSDATTAMIEATWLGHIGRYLWPCRENYRLSIQKDRSCKGANQGFSLTPIEQRVCVP